MPLFDNYREGNMALQQQLKKIMAITAITGNARMEEKTYHSGILREQKQSRKSINAVLKK